MSHIISWFEIPAIDLERARTFYQTILETTLERIPETEMLAFPADSSDTPSGALVTGDGYGPAASGGVLVYLNATGRLDAILGRVEAAGGKIEMPHTPIPPHGAMAMIIDTEGNRIGLHSDH